ncbi:hypothetical protein BOX15_Mlig000174g3 [Macrostomum lignano]|uniref:EGF-like domain-containing protein n=2 Tax=Macrostomum lignano TaxID=282301 RepID=A0A267DGT1_9PLAT|nr:hypothetical protein BOX15_Mlig000174g3 [Macrostomum lignano]
MWREYEVQFVFIMSCLSLHYISNCAFALVKDKTSIVVNSASIDSDKSAVEQRQQLRSDLVAVIGQRSGLSIIINGRETGIPSLADQACHAVAYARNGPLFVATDRKIFRLDASVGLPIEAADSDARASGSGRRVGGGGSGDGGRAQAIIADHIIQALAVDDIGRKVYWVTSTDLRAGQVSTLNVDNYNGTDRRTLFRMPATHTILSHTLAVDSLHACLIFFVDVQTHSAALGVKQLHIHRLDGQEVYNVSHISEANSIVAVTVDAENAIIYWMESNSGDTPVQVRGFSYSTLLPTFAASASPSAQAPPSPFAVLDIAKIDRPSNTLAYQGGRLYWMRGLEIVACELGAGSGSATTAACRTALTRSNSRAGEILFHLVLLSKSDYRAWPAAFTDVCSVRKPCAHLCFRYSSTIADQRYTCLCRFGLLPDPKNATHGCLTTYTDYLLISLDMGTSSSVLKMSLDTQDYHPVQLFGMPKYIVKCLAMDPLANVIYWIDYLHERVARSVTETIRRLDLTRNQPGRIEKILENADEVPQDLAVDWSSGNLYWVTARKLIISKLDGRHQYVLSTFDKITAVKVDPIRGYLFYCADGRLVRSRLDGVSQRLVLLNLTSSHFCQLAFDEATGDIYYLASPPGRLGVFQFSSGGAVSANISLSRAVAAVRSPAKVYAAFRGHLYWLSTSGDMSLGIVDRNGSNTRVVPISLRIPLSLAASSSQLATEFAAEIDSNPCRRPDNAGCEQLCIPRPDLTHLPVANRRICRCASRFRFAGTVSSSTGGESAPAPEDGHSRCQALSTFLVLASARDIGMAPLNLAAGSASSPDYESLHLSNDLKFVEFVAADPSRGRICWADVGRHIACAGLDRGTGADTAAGRSARVVVPAVTQPLGLAVDWATNLLFYIDKWPWPRLCAVSLDRPSLTRTLLVSDRLSGARGLVFDSNVFRLFWIDIKYKDQGRIDWLGFVSVAAPMDVEIETGTVLTGLGDPRHLALDQASRRLYFSDDKSVKSVTYEGQELRTLPLSVKPVGVAYHNSTVHFVALNSRRIHRVRVSPVTGEFVANRDEFGSGSVELPSGFRPISLILFDTDSARPPNAGNALKTRNFCLRNRCQHFCLLTRQLEIACACSDLHRRAPGDSGGFTEQCEPVSDWLHLVTDKGLTIGYPVGSETPSQLRQFTVSQRPGLPSDIIRVELLLTDSMASATADSPSSSGVYFLYLRRRGPVLLHNPATGVWRTLIRGQFLDMALEPVNRLLYLAEETAIVAHRLEPRLSSASSAASLPVEASALHWLIRNCSLEACRPVGLAIDPLAGHLYWMDRDSSDRTEEGAHLLHRCRLDGTGETRLDSMESELLMRPSSSLRFHSGGSGAGLYWTSNLGAVSGNRNNWALLKLQLPASITPSNASQLPAAVRPIANVQLAGPYRNVTPFSLGDGRAYVLNSSRQISVYNCKEKGALPPILLPSDLGLDADRPVVTAMVAASIPQRRSVLQSGYAASCHRLSCSHICLPQSLSAASLTLPSCACPSGFELKDSGSFSHTPPTVCSPAPFTCSPREFTCRRRRQCVPLSALCDGRPDCHDTTDESCCDRTRGLRDVKSLPCRAQISGRPQCLALALWCDGAPQCSDASDQSEALCSESVVTESRVAEAAAAAEAAEASGLAPSSKPPIGHPGDASAGMMSGHGVFVYLLVPLLIGVVVLLPLLGYCCTRDKPALRLHVPEMAEMRPLPASATGGASRAAAAASVRDDKDPETMDDEDDDAGDGDDDDELDFDDDFDHQQQLPRCRSKEDLSSVATSAAAAAARAASSSKSSNSMSSQQQQQLCEYVETLNPPPSPCTDCSSLPGAAAAAARFHDFDDASRSGSDAAAAFYYSNNNHFASRHRRQRGSSGGSGEQQQELLVHQQHQRHSGSRRRRRRQRSRSRAAAAAAPAASASGVAGRRAPVSLIAPPYDSPYHQLQPQPQPPRQPRQHHRQHRSAGGAAVRHLLAWLLCAPRQPIRIRLPRLTGCRPALTAPSRWCRCC